MSSAIKSMDCDPQPMMGKDSVLKKANIFDTPMTRSNWYKHVNWLNLILIVLIPIYGMIQALWVPLQWKTGIWAFMYYFLTGLGITAGN